MSTPIDERLNGRCSCGAVAYSLRVPTEFVSHCHCASCRRAHAAPLVTWTSVPNDALRIEGDDQLTRYESSPGVVRSFCRTCGTPMIFVAADTPDRVYVPLATLIQAPDQLPDSHVSWEEHVAWIDGMHDLPRFRAKTEQTLK